MNQSLSNQEIVHFPGLVHVYLQQFPGLCQTQFALLLAFSDQLHLELQVRLRLEPAQRTELGRGKEGGERVVGREGEERVKEGGGSERGGWWGCRREGGESVRREGG